MISSSRSELAAIADAIPHIVWVADETGDVFFWNEMYYQATGLPRDVPIGEREWTRIIEPGDLAAVLASRTAAFAAGEAYEQELRIRPIGDDRYRWFRYRERPSRGADGSIVAWFGAMADIDDEVRAYEETHARASRFREIAETLATLVWTARADGTIDFVGATLRARLAARGVADAPQPWLALAHPDDRPAIEAALAATRTDGAPRDLDARLADGPPGDYRWFALQLRRFAVDGMAARWIGTAIDVDDRIRAARRSEAIIGSLVDALVPRRMPATPPFEIDAWYVPAEEESHVGGDFYDAVEMPDGRLVFALGDVAGHGVDAAVVMTRARDAILSSALDETDPAAILRRANRVLRLYDETMVTAIVGSLDPSRSTLRYAAAGHPPPILVRAGEPPDVLPVGGTPLGILADIAVRTHDAPFLPGDMLVLYTDGITEYDRDVELGERRLVATAAAAYGRPEPARSIVTTLLGARRAPDDIAVFTIRRDGPETR